MTTFREKSDIGSVKISLGPVFSVNPQCVERIVTLPESIGDPTWINVHCYGDIVLQTELESPQTCKDLVAEFIAANPAIRVEEFK